MFYPEDVVEDIRAANDIVDVISDYVTLKQKGSNYFGLCPFHKEGTPSFSVSSDKQMYYCFGCGASGNVYSFIMQKENHDFVDSIKILAERVHYDLPERGYSIVAKKQSELKNNLMDIHKLAARFYYDILNSTDGQNAIKYLNNRDVSIVARKKFGLGYASSKSSMFKYLSGKGYDVDTILKSGLVIADKKGGYFDRFLNRLMFPIFDVQSKIIGFGGRQLGNGEPKYLNSPDTILFDKSHNLYSINYARQAKSKEIIIVEGYMDVISLYQAGIHNVVAALGTAFNVEHAKLLKKYCEKTILLFDSDSPGEKAVLRAIPILVSNGLKPKVLQLKNAKDPDEYIKKFGKISFLKDVSKAVDYIVFQVACMQKDYDLSDSSQKSEFTNKAGNLISYIQNAIDREIYIEDISVLTGVSIEAITQETNKIISDRVNFVQEKKYINKPNFYSKKDGNKGVDEARRNIIYVISSNINNANEIKNHIQSEELILPFYIKLFDTIYEAYNKKQAIYPAEIINHFELLEDQKRVSSIFTVKLDYTDKTSLIKALNDQIRVIKSAYIDEMIINAKDLSKLQKLGESKRNLKNSYITDLDG